jgi:hypothetical protein
MAEVQRIEVGVIKSRTRVYSPTISLSMPVEWMTEGFADASGAVRQAMVATADGNSRDVTKALFVLCAWLDSLNDRFPRLSSSVHVKALLFVRNRTHHNFAAALYRSADTDEWMWQDTSVFPEPPPEFRNERGRRAYLSVCARKPLRTTLTAVETTVRRAI